MSEIESKNDDAMARARSVLHRYNLDWSPPPFMSSTAYLTRCQICQTRYKKPQIRPQTHQICQVCIAKQLEICNQGHREDVQCTICQKPRESSNVVFINSELSYAVNYPIDTSIISNNLVTSSQVNGETSNSMMKNIANMHHLIDTNVGSNLRDTTTVVSNKAEISNNRIKSARSFCRPMDNHPAQQYAYIARQYRTQQMMRQQKLKVTQQMMRQQKLKVTQQMMRKQQPKVTQQIISRLDNY